MDLELKKRRRFTIKSKSIFPVLIAVQLLTIPLFTTLSALNVDIVSKVNAQSTPVTSQSIADGKRFGINSITASEGLTTGPGTMASASQRYANAKAVGAGVNRWVLYWHDVERYNYHISTGSQGEENIIYNQKNINCDSTPNYNPAGVPTTSINKYDNRLDPKDSVWTWSLADVQTINATATIPGGGAANLPKREFDEIVKLDAQNEIDTLIVLQGVARCRQQVAENDVIPYGLNNPTNANEANAVFVDEQGNPKFDWDYTKAMNAYNTRSNTALTKADFINPNNPWAFYVFKAIERYGIDSSCGLGTTTNCVKYFQIWNEVNDPNTYWPHTKEEYAFMVQASYHAGKFANDSVEFLLAGMTGTDQYQDEAEIILNHLNGAIPTFGTTPVTNSSNVPYANYLSYIDKYALHEYCNPWGIFSTAKRFRNLPLPNKPIWVTEYGTTGCTATDRYSYAIQALTYLLAVSPQYNIERVVHFAYGSDPGTQNAKTDGPYTELLDTATGANSAYNQRTYFDAYKIVDSFVSDAILATSPQHQSGQTNTTHNSLYFDPGIWTSGFNHFDTNDSNENDAVSNRTNHHWQAAYFEPTTKFVAKDLGGTVLQTIGGTPLDANVVENIIVVWATVKTQNGSTIIKADVPSAGTGRKAYWINIFQPTPTNQVVLGGEIHPNSSNNYELQLDNRDDFAPFTVNNESSNFHTGGIPVILLEIDSSVACADPGPIGTTLLASQNTNSTRSAFIAPEEAPTPANLGECSPGQFGQLYYNKNNLRDITDIDFNTAQPVYYSEDTALNYEWIEDRKVLGSGTPFPGFVDSNFAAIYRGKFNFEEGEYLFKTKADEGIKVYLDDNKSNPIIDQWGGNTDLEDSALFRFNQAGEHTVTVEYYDKRSDAQLNLDWSKTCSAPAGEFCVNFFNNKTGDGVPAKTMIEPYSKLTTGNGVSHTWNKTSTIPTGVNLSPFTATWEGKVLFDEEDYVFYTDTTDSMKLYVDGNLLLDSSISRNTKLISDPQALSEGIHVVKVEYLNSTGDANMQFYWNTAPKITNKNTASKFSGTNARYVHYVTSEDLEGDDLTYSLVNPLTGMSIDNNGKFIWTNEITGNKTITIEVSDGELKDTETIAINVLFANGIDSTNNNVIVGQTGEISNGVYNSGNAGMGNLYITSVTIMGDTDQIVLTQDNCTGSVLPPSPDASIQCRVYFDFSPTQLGTRTIVIKYTSNASNSPFYVALVAEGLDPTAVNTFSSESSEFKTNTVLEELPIAIDGSVVKISEKQKKSNN
jgi:hypothetical protein